MDLPQANVEDALTQPTRARLFRLLGDLGRPSPTDELAERLGLHPNGVRVHLDRLAEAGLVVRRRARRPRGRPRHEWSISTQAKPGGAAPRAYGDLARWLARAIAPTPSELRRIEVAGREIGRELAPAGAASAEVALQDTMAALGFQPVLERDASGRLCCRLHNCPYCDSVKENPEVVCTLHRGITRGLLDVLEPAAKLVSFVPHDPESAGCELEVEGLPATA
ncbi:MAG: helix-turn-helix domain-containing protein [Solirubrobacteraceae bacterium MAG38_C4-C5]|nr:helix-turn-helix domain-containing protein [Candidatus Siliceabacter maunaloa]